jgi:hypothetical protein
VVSRRVPVRRQFHRRPPRAPARHPVERDVIGPGDTGRQKDARGRERLFAAPRCRPSKTKTRDPFKRPGGVAGHSKLVLPLVSFRCVGPM